MKAAGLGELENLRLSFNEFIRKMKKQGQVSFKRLAEMQSLVNDYLTIAMEVDLGIFDFDSEEEAY